MQEIRIPLWDDVILVAGGIENDSLECKGIVISVERGGKCEQDLASVRMACYHENGQAIPIPGKFEICVFSNTLNQDWENRFVIDERREHT